MPVLDGIQASKKILQFLTSFDANEKEDGNEQLEDLDLIKIVAVTAYTDEKTKQQCKNAGIKEVYNKPLSSEQVSDIMNKYFFSTGSS